MKKRIKLLPVFIFTLFLTFTAFAQCENAYFPFQEGVSMELTNYKPNGKETGKAVSDIISMDGNTVIVNNKIFDKKGELVSDGEYEVICEDGTIKMDMERFIPDELIESYQDMEMTVEGDFLEIPNDLEVGQTLPDGTGKITIKMGGGSMNMNTSMDMTFTARNVEKQETITTPAGTFETYKITQTTISEMKMMGMSRETTFTSASWIARDVGTVKSESYDKKGKVDSYTLLTEFDE